MEDGRLINHTIVNMYPYPAGYNLVKMLHNIAYLLYNIIYYFLHNNVKEHMVF